MTASTRQNPWIVAAFLLAVGLASAGVWRYGYGQALDQLARRAEADLELVSDRLSTQLHSFQELAVLMADHPALSDLDEPIQRAAAQVLLRAVADKTGALEIAFADRSGRILVAAEGVLGADLRTTAYFRRATHGALGSAHGVALPLERRAFYYAAPVFAPTGAVRGALIVVVDVEAIEGAWRGDTPVVFFTDRDRGEVFVSNRSELLFWRRAAGSPGLAPADGGPHDFSARRVGGHEVWQTGWGPYVPGRALHLARDLPVIGLHAEVLADVAPALRLAGLQAAAVAAMFLAFGALMFLATERRRALALANMVLESRVAERTRALSAANAALRREVAERQEAEAALKRAQADLVQAGKLGALGQMSAGISHELNQPLMAIRSFAENAEQFLARGRTDTVAANLQRISDLARRMGRIIKNLRAFARQETEPAVRVDLVAILKSVIELTGPRLRQDCIALDYQAPAHPVWVRGGEVRLGQVFVNLITNAADAMAGGERRELTLTVTPDDGGGNLTVGLRDTGPGLAAPEKVFEPFYSTKEVGASEGMGLGLSISYGIVQSFGGEIRGSNAPGGGALFTVRLDRWRDKETA